MNQKRQFLMHLFILLFAVSASVAIIPCSTVYTLGLFGEVKASTVTEDSSFLEELAKQIHSKTHKNKGTTIINFWYELWCGILCMVFVVYMGKLPRGDTIITLKVRMDN